MVGWATERVSLGMCRGRSRRWQQIRSVRRLVVVHRALHLWIFQNYLKSATDAETTRTLRLDSTAGGVTGVALKGVLTELAPGSHAMQVTGLPGEPTPPS